MIKAYREQHPNRQKCDYGNPPQPGKTCEFDLENLRPCAPSTNYGLDAPGACVILKLRRNPEWSPEFYNSSDKLPETMPVELKAAVPHFYQEKPKVCMAVKSNEIRFIENPVNVLEYRLDLLRRC